MMQDSDELSGLIVNLVQAIDRMSAVISEILLISRVASGQTEPVFNIVQVANLVGRVMDDYRLPLEQRNLTIQTELDQAPTTLYADRGLLALALGNLLSNAIKYTPDGGTITIRAVEEDGQAVISVRDTGIGVDPQDHLLIFESFYTANSTHLHSTSKVAFRGGGLGLGLVICKEIVRAHGGKIWVESPGYDEASLPGSTFFMALPLKSRQAGALLLTEVI
jgi:two-component system sensor histidine kinase VicK